MLRLNRGLKLFSSLRPNKRGGSDGFTLIELLVVVAILGSLFAMAISAIASKLPTWRLQEAANEVAQRMQFARSEAVKRHKTVIMQFSNIGNSSTASISIWVDDDGDNAPSVGDELLQTVIFPDKHTNAYISVTADGNGATINSLALNGRGTIKSLNGSTSSGTMPVRITVTSTSSTTPATYVVNISRSGVARVE